MTTQDPQRQPASGAPGPADRMRPLHRGARRGVPAPQHSMACTDAPTADATSNAPTDGVTGAGLAPTPSAAAPGLAPAA